MTLHLVEARSAAQHAATKRRPADSNNASFKHGFRFAGNLFPSARDAKQPVVTFVNSADSQTLRYSGHSDVETPDSRVRARLACCAAVAPHLSGACTSQARQTPRENEPERDAEGEMGEASTRIILKDQNTCFKRSKNYFVISLII